MFTTRYLCIVIPFLVLYCSAPLQKNRALDYRKVDLSYDRSLCGRAPLPFWFHLTEPEIEVLNSIEKAKAGDPKTLLSLALIASGDVREPAAFKKHHDRVSRFVEEIRPEVENEDDLRKKSLLLYHRMWDEFLLTDPSSDLAGYRFGQSRLSVLLEKGVYNCISSAMLYIILARWFDMDVDGVITEGHAFVQITTSNGNVVEVETTSRDGFGWVHNEEFYRRQSPGWFKKRGIVRQSMDEYALRKIVEPYLLICHNMNNQHTDFGRMPVEDVHRLIEFRAYVDDANLQSQIDLINIYRIELSDLNKKHHTTTIHRFYRTIIPRVKQVLHRAENDSLLMTSMRLLFKQFLIASERDIASVLARDTCTGADSAYGFFTDMVKEVHRTIPGDTTLFDLSMRMSRSVMNQVANRVAELLEKQRYTFAASHYRAAESFVAMQERLFPDDDDIRFQSGYFEEKKQMVLFAEKDIDAFIAFTRMYLEKIRQDTVNTGVLLRNALFNTFLYIQHCTEQKEFSGAERLIDTFSIDLASDSLIAQNIQWALGEAFQTHSDMGNWPEAMRICKKKIAVDLNNDYTKANAGNLQYVYQNWAIAHYNNGKQLRALEILNDCINDPDAKHDECEARLQEWEKRRKEN